MIEAPKTKSSNLPKILLIVGGILIALCVVCGVFSLIISKATPNAADLAATAAARAYAPMTQIAATYGPGQAQSFATFDAGATQFSVTANAVGSQVAVMMTQPPPQQAPAAGSAGQTRDNPLPGGAGLDIGGDTRLTVLSVVRPANSQVKAGNMFNATPAAGLEYAAVKIQVDCGKAVNDKCSFLPMELKSVGSDGQVRELQYVAGIPDDMSGMSYEFFGGSKISGVLVFLFPKNDTSVVLFHEALIFGTPVYFSLP